MSVWSGRGGRRPTVGAAPLSAEGQRRGGRAVAVVVPIAHATSCEIREIRIHVRACVVQGEVCVSRPFNTGSSPLSDSGNPGVKRRISQGGGAIMYLDAPVYIYGASRYNIAVAIQRRPVCLLSVL